MKQVLKPQIVIVGAGPAGIATALFLAKKQIPSLVVEKAVFPRHKACGDNITSVSLRVLNELDPSWIPLLTKKGQFVPSDGVVAYAPNGHYLSMDFLPLEKGTTQNSCYTISRIEFDNFLIERAKENPYITLIEDCNITQIERMASGGLRLTSKSKEWVIESEMVVFSTGSNNNHLQRLAGEKKEAKHLAVGVRAYFEGVKPCEKKNFCELFIIDKFLPGGLFLTPIADGKMNVNVTVRSDVVIKKNLNLTELMLQTLATNPLLKERFKHAKMIGKPQGSSLFLGTKKRKISGDNFVAVGDAAGLIDLVSANGVPQAMLSAKIAAEEISRCMVANDFSAQALAPYDALVYKRVENYLKMSKLVTPFASNPIFLQLLVWVMNFIAKHLGSTQELQGLLYRKSILHKLIKPTFYYRLFFGIKNTDALTD